MNRVPKEAESTLKLYGQLVIGPPGSGKTTYCQRMSQHLIPKHGEDNVKIINLDPGNDALPYKVDLDVGELISVADVMEKMNLGPNGALLYCMQFIDEHFEEFVIEALRKIFDCAKKDQPGWILFDMPGQVELYTHVQSVKNIVKKLENHMTLCTLNLVDSHYCSDPGKYISCLLTSLTTMLHISTPHLNVLTKVDLAEKYGKLPFNLEFYTDVLDLSYLVEWLDSDKRMEKYKQLSAAIANIIENYGLVSFHPLDVQNDALVDKLAKIIDKAVWFKNRRAKWRKREKGIGPNGSHHRMDDSPHHGHSHNGNSSIYGFTSGRIPSYAMGKLENINQIFFQ